MSVPLKGFGGPHGGTVREQAKRRDFVALILGRLDEGSTLRPVEIEAITDNIVELDF